MLRAGTIAKPAKAGSAFVGSIDASDTLESIIALAAGRVDASVRVTDNGEIVGAVDMCDLLTALVPYKSDRVMSLGKS